MLISFFGLTPGNSGVGGVEQKYIDRIVGNHALHVAKHHHGCDRQSSEKTE